MDANAYFDDSGDASALRSAGQVLMQQIHSALPRFGADWEKHLEFWDGEVAGPFNDISPFAHFIDEELFNKGEIEEVRRAMLLLEELFKAGDQSTRNLIGIGFIEDLSNITSWRPSGHSTVIPLLPETLLEVWKEIERQWAGKSSLIEVIEAERNGPH